MATTTPNYGWTVPTSSDLVKNGATAIETLGDSVDASLWNVGFGQAGKNKIINGDFGIWQRGTSFTTPAAAYTADRYEATVVGSGTVAIVSRQSFTAGNTISGYESPYFLRFALTTIGTSPTLVLKNKIEDVRTFAGQIVTLSFWAKNQTTKPLAVYVDQIFGSGGSSSVFTTVNSNVSIGTSWTRYTFTFTMPSISGKTVGTGSHTDIYLNIDASATNQFDIWGVQLEAGSTATPFQTATGTIQGELAACQRYLPVLNNFAIINGYAYGTNTSIYAVPFKVQARVAPTGITVAGTINAYALNTSTSVTPTFNIGSVDSASILTTQTIVAGQGSRIEMQSNASILFTGCEL